MAYATDLGARLQCAAIRAPSALHAATCPRHRWRNPMPKSVLSSLAVRDAPSPVHAPAPYAPWSDDLSAEARAELVLPGGEALPQETVDVAVIGAGVAGLSAALAAAQAGASVVVLEAAQAIGQGATGRNAGILS